MKNRTYSVTKNVKDDINSMRYKYLKVEPKEDILRVIDRSSFKTSDLVKTQLLNPIYLQPKGLKAPPKIPTHQYRRRFGVQNLESSSKIPPLDEESLRPKEPRTCSLFILQSRILEEGGLGFNDISSIKGKKPIEEESSASSFSQGSKLEESTLGLHLTIEKEKKKKKGKLGKKEVLEIVEK
jgi:hypothetical protein